MGCRIEIPVGVDLSVTNNVIRMGRVGTGVSTKTGTRRKIPVPVERRLRPERKFSTGKDGEYYFRLICLRLVFAYTGVVPTARTCSVSFTDAEGITHAVEITTCTLFEAAVLARAEFRRC